MYCSKFNSTYLCALAIKVLLTMKCTLSQLIFQAFKKVKGDINKEMGINIDITDTNDNEPKFNNHMYEVTIEETPSQGKILTLWTLLHY